MNALPTGYALHEYRIEKVLGVGGFGLTYLALDGNLNLKVAIKEYLPEDIATRGPDRCACGSPFGTLRAIDGRTQDYFRLPDGRVLHPMEITSIIRDSVFRSMRQYQIVQETRHRVVARVIARSDDCRADIEETFRQVESFLGPGVEVVIDWVNEIPAGPGGKIGEYRSLVLDDIV